MLINARRYNVNNPKITAQRNYQGNSSHLSDPTHTVPQRRLGNRSDSTKLKVYGYDAPVEEVIDPTKEHLGKSVVGLLKEEATDFTDWLRKNTINYLQEVAERNLLIPLSRRDTLSTQLGGGKEWDAVPWTE